MFGGVGKRGREVERERGEDGGERERERERREISRLCFIYFSDGV